MMIDYCLVKRFYSQKHQKWLALGFFLITDILYQAWLNPDEKHTCIVSIGGPGASHYYLYDYKIISGEIQSGIIPSTSLSLDEWKNIITSMIGPPNITKDKPETPLF